MCNTMAMSIVLKHKAAAWAVPNKFDSKQVCLRLCPNMTVVTCQPLQKVMLKHGISLRLRLCLVSCRLER